MVKETWILQFILILLVQCCYLASTMEEKAETAVPVSFLSPPEGNTTFLDGTTWCVALAGASQIDLQNALDWACGLGKADCKAIQDGGLCYEPDTLVSHASYAFNNYYQQNGNSDIACNFGGTAAVTKHNPSRLQQMCLCSPRISKLFSTYILQANNKLNLVESWRNLTTFVLEKLMLGR
ncbi:glucan endo-1,3-beta-glucosidase 13 isoform X1 [Citrus clementina]|nr:glucan endo-1,3-beta-glucosidase 13 isoform X1 [Citrus x clementina]